MHPPRHCEYNNKDEANSPNTLNDKNQDKDNVNNSFGGSNTQNKGRTNKKRVNEIRKKFIGVFISSALE